jgi:hypothetical protein
MEKLLLEKITYENTTYILSEPLELEFHTEDGIHTAENKKLGLHGFGKDNKFEAIESFQEEFDFIYRRYNQLLDSLLSDNVIKIKQELNRIVIEVITVKNL